MPQTSMHKMTIASLSTTELPEQCMWNKVIAMILFQRKLKDFFNSYSSS